MNKIKELRLINNMKQTELAKLLQVTQGTLSHWENGLYEPDISAINRLSKIFDVSIEHLLGISDEKKAHSPESERANIDNKIIEIYDALPPEKQKLVEDYLDFLLARQEQPEQN